LIIAFITALGAHGGDVTGGLNGFIANLSSRSALFLGNIGLLTPLGFAFAAGMVSTVNPCGFAMLPAYLGLYLGSDESIENISPLSHMAKALLIGMVVTSGFIILFGTAGIVIALGIRSIIGYIPWLGLGIGIVLTFMGAWLITGGSIYSRFAADVASKLGDPTEVTIKGYFVFGLSYGIASLSCTLPIFLSVTGITFTDGSPRASIAAFVMYGAGMGTVIIFMTLGMAIVKEATVGLIKKFIWIVQPMSTVMLILAGSYLFFYWLTVGGIL
jgi:cytochrome c biogenesis protein CcdA